MAKKELTLPEIIDAITPVNQDWIAKACDHTAQLVMPTRALGRLHDLAERICAIQETLHPAVNQKTVLIMAGDHGIVDEGVSAYPQIITGEMVKTFLHGGAGINAIARHVEIDVWVVDMGIIPDIDVTGMERKDRFRQAKVACGTSNFAKGPAMTLEQAEKGILAGFHIASEQFERGTQILGTGDMGIGNTTPSAAIGAVVTGIAPDDMVGRGTGVDDAGFLKKKDAVQRGIAQNRPDPHNGLDVLSKVGGFEIGGIAGCILAGAYHRRPVVIDGFISTAGALVAHTLCPKVSDYLFAGHCSAEGGHRLMLKYLGLEPILDLGMRLGEGTGGALDMNIIDGALGVFKEVLTFEQAGVTNKE